VKDLRTNGTNPMVPTKPGDFWPTLDALCETIGTGFSPYKLNGAVALADTPYRKSRTTHYHGIFRFAVKSIEVARDEDADVHQCRVVLDTAWEPRFQALFVNLEQAKATFAEQRVKLEGDGSFSVAGKCATQGIKVTMTAPPRATATLDSLSGTIRVIGVPKVLEFNFAKLKDKNPILNDMKDDVKVSVTSVEARKTRWSVEVETVHPPGALFKLQSFEEPVLQDQSRAWLTWGRNPKTKQPYELESRPSEQDPQESKEGTKMRYHFTARADTPLPPPGAEVTLRYRTPSRLVAFTVPFEFRNVALP
jgi:hypothetical protein